MSRNYARGIPVGNNQTPFYHSPPPEISLATTVVENATASSILVLNAGTTAIEVMATNGTAYLKWLSQSVVDSSVAGTSVISAAGTANFDAMVASNTIRRFVIPVATTVAPVGAYTTPQGANKDNNLYPNVAIKSGGIASVAVIQN